MTINTGFKTFLLLAVVSFLTSCSDSSSTSQSATSPVPNNQDGKIIFVNYWAEWCKPCRDEIPELNAFQEAYIDQVQMYGVNFDGLVGDALVKAETNLGITFPTLDHDPGYQLELERPVGLPVTRVLSPTGEYLLELSGEQTMLSLSQALEGVIEKGEPMISVKGYVSGKVQGVWFRKYVQQGCQSLKLSGYAKNLPDGRVEVLLSGHENVVEKGKSVVEQGSPASRVSGVEWQQLPSAINSLGFDVL